MTAAQIRAYAALRVLLPPQVRIRTELGWREDTIHVAATDGSRWLALDVRPLPNGDLSDSIARAIQRYDWPTPVAPAPNAVLGRDPISFASLEAGAGPL